MPAVTQEKHKDGDFFVDYEDKVFEDVQGRTGPEGSGHVSHRRL